MHTPQKNMLADTVLFLAAGYFLWIPGKAVRLRDCAPGSKIEIEETDTNVPITCDQFGANDTVGWGFYTSPDAADPTTVGNCYPDGQCDDSPNPITRSDATTSILTIASPSRVFGSFDVHCEANGSTARCQLNLIYPASMTSSNCSVDINTTSDTWTVDGSCYVSKAFSSRQHYNCQWAQTSDKGVITTPPNQTDDQTSSPVRDYYSYTCRFSTPVPQLSGTYTYTVTAFPGDVTITAGSYRVELPSSPDSGCVDGYYIAGDTLNCTCTLSNPGRPAATPVWSHDVSSGPRLQMVVTSQDHNRRLTCQARWGNRVVTHTIYVIRVAYGPASVTLSDPGHFDLHPTSPSELSLTCNATDYNPGVTFVWNGQCANVTDRICRFRPAASNDNDVVTCTVTNNVTSNVQFNSRTLNIQYPPMNPPVITGYGGESLFEGETRNITCSVAGGNPPVMAVTFGCTGQGTEVLGTNSSVMVMANRSNHDNVCRCGARWKTYSPGWYTLTANVTVIVYHGPAPPVVSHKDQPYPFLAGESPTLYCSFRPGDDPGNPAAMLSWRGHDGSANQTEAHLTLTQLSGIDNGRSEVCEARNAFTDHRASPVSTSMVIEVYYLDVITVTSLTSDRCDRSTPNTCVVTEGQRVHLNCSADSNPSLATVAWQHSGTPVLDLVAGRNTSIRHTCNVTTMDNGDSRLPLQSSLQFDVLVMYTAEVMEFKVNNQSKGIAVNETDLVIIVCTAAGRPTPAMNITHNGQRVTDRPQGQVTTQDTAMLMYTVPVARCEDAGHYSCGVATDDHTVTTANALFIHVFCEPRVSDPDDKINLSVNYISEPINVPLTLVAYPLPHTFDVIFMGPGRNMSQTARDVIVINCYNTSTDYDVVCVLTVSDASEDDAGYYDVMIGNTVGVLTVGMEVQYRAPRGTSEPTTKEAMDPTVIGGAVAAAVVVVAVVVVVVIFVIKRRRKGNKKAEQGIQGGRDSPVRHLSGSQHRSARRDNYEDTDIDPAPLAVESEPAPEQAATPSGSDDAAVYSVVVKKGSRTQPAPSPNAETELYAVVNKKTPQSSRPPPSDEENACAPPLPATLSEVEAEPIAERSSEGARPKKGKAKGKRPKKDETKELLQTQVKEGNPTSAINASVYANANFENEETTFSSTSEPFASDGGSRAVNQDGLVYVKVEFSERQKMKETEEAPVREITEYVDIDFAEMARMAKR